MGKKGWLLVFAGIAGLIQHLPGQVPFRISDPVIQQEQDQVRINYDLLESDSTEFFNISLHISDSEGRLIQARALSGDVGRAVAGGAHKLILWDPGEDQIYLNEQIFIQVAASRLQEAAMVTDQQVDLRALTASGNGSGYTTTRSGNRMAAPAASRYRSFSRTGIVIQSLLVPGLGLSRISGKPHWLRGLAGYGCLAGAVYYNLKSFYTYESILDYTGFEEQQQQLQLSFRQDQISEALVFAAAGIWAADLVWTLAGSRGALRRSNSLWKSEARDRGSGFSLKTGIAPAGYFPTLGFMYKF